MADEIDAGELVELRAFRGTRRSSVYRDHVLPERRFARIVEAGEELGLTVLASLAQYGPHELDQAAAQRLADEATVLRSSGRLLELDSDLTSIAEVARWCAHARGHAWLRIEGP